MSDSTRTFEEALGDFVDSRLRGLRVSMPGRVEKYDASTQKADVQPLIQSGHTQEDGERTSLDLPMVLDVPVQFQGAGDFGVTFPVAVGSIVLLVFADFSLDKWLTHGKDSPVDPLDDRAHHISDAIAIPGLRTFNDPTDQVSSDSNVIRGKTRIGSKDAADPVVRQSDLADLKIWLDTLVLPVSGASAGPVIPANLSPTITGNPEVLTD